MINKVTLIGHLGKDPEVRHLENGSSVARITVATNESYKDKEGNWQTTTDWHNVVAWRALAERAERELKKGSLVYVEGRIRTRSYQDNNGVERYVTEVEALTLRSLDRRDRNDVPLPSGQDDYQYQPKTKDQNIASAPQQPSQHDASMPTENDDLPF